jgi:hypothetical protein
MELAWFAERMIHDLVVKETSEYIVSHLTTK